MSAVLLVRTSGSVEMFAVIRPLAGDQALATVLVVADGGMAPVAVADRARPLLDGAERESLAGQLDLGPGWDRRAGDR